MLFNSIEFLIFLLMVIPAYFLAKSKYRWILLLAASYFFYMWWRYELIILIIISTLIDYFCGQKMSEKDTKQERRPYLLISLISNLGLLFTFKYLDFFTQTINTVLNSNIPLVGLILPMGISFYTFQTLSYSIDIYHGKLKSEKHLGKFALYVSFFPQLVAGPIERARKLLPQLQKNDNKLTYDNIVSGLTQIIIGFFKKVVIADTIAIYVNSIYGPYELYTGFTFWFATYLFAIQIYCDFSGYTDIAIGTARLLGYNLMENFKQPYFAKSVTEFWQRWHISLSTWLRDYLYIPLGGNRFGKFKTYRNLMITMLLGGLWHGSSWNFVIWGILNGTYLAIERKFTVPDLVTNAKWYVRLFSGLFVFHLICITWVFFRAETFNGALYILEHMFKPDYFLNLQIKDTGVFATIVLTTVLFFLLEVLVLGKLKFNSDNIGFKPWFTIGLSACLFLVILLFGNSEGSQFIYFQF